MSSNITTKYWSDNITTKYCKWTKVRKWLCYFDTSFLVAFHTMLYSFDNIESSVVHCKCFKVSKEIKRKSATRIEIKCTHYKSHRSEHNYFFPMIHKEPGRRLWYTRNSLGVHRYMGFPVRSSLLGPLMTMTKSNFRIKTK